MLNQQSWLEFIRQTARLKTIIKMLETILWATAWLDRIEVCSRDARPEQASSYNTAVILT
jgi:hypothetical protein